MGRHDLWPVPRQARLPLEEQRISSKQQSGLQPIGETQLLENVPDVLLDRGATDAEGGRDLFVGLTLGDQRRHLDLADGEPRVSAMRSPVFTDDDRRHRGHAGNTAQVLSPGDGAEGIEEFSGFGTAAQRRVRSLSGRELQAIDPRVT